MLKRIFHYFEPLWLGKDKKISLRSVLAMVLTIDFISNMSFAVRKWTADRSMEGLSLILGIEAGLIAALLALRTYQSVQSVFKQSTEVTDDPSVVKQTTEVKGDIPIEQIPNK